MVDRLAPFEIVCPACNGEGEVDSGGFDPQGHPIEITCPGCNGHGKVIRRASVWNRLRALQDTAEYAAPELQSELAQQKAILLDILDQVDNEGRYP